MDTDSTRRAFLVQASASMAMFYIGARTQELLAQAHARAKSVAAGTTTTYWFFTPQQAAAFDAFSAQIFPTDDTPGAREANVVHFTDYAFSTFDQDLGSAPRLFTRILVEAFPV